MIEQIGIRAVFLIEDVGQREEFFLGLKQRLLHPLEADLAAAQIFVDPERDESGLEDVLIKAVITQGVYEFDEMLQLPGVDDTETIHIPSHGITGLSDPPIMIVTETNDTPVESSCSFGHG